MLVGELFPSAIIQVLFDRLASPELLRFLRQEGLYSKIKKWEETLQMILAVLGDAEGKQFMNDRDVKEWLDKLQDLAYDAEDLLDEFATEAFARNLKIDQQQASTSKGLNLLPDRFNNWSPGAIKFNIRMRSEIKNVTSRLEDLCKLGDGLGLKVIIGGTSSYALPRRTPTSCFPIEPAVHGRDADKKKILKMVLKNEPSDANFHVIPIVGMGGVGKTTLARQVYNDWVVKCFNVKAWVCVSDDFDVLRISKATLEAITGYSCDLKDLVSVQFKLKQELAGRKFLLVLDDVWSKDNYKWEILKSPFMACAPSSRILVTTRLREVALNMRPSGFYQLNLLPNEDCWSVFSMHAFENGDIPAYLSTELIHQKVVERSGGLPLAAKTLGGLLRSKQTEDEWLEILNSNIWDLSEENEIPTALRLSYYHLPSCLKRCFSYCSIFPKDYEFEEEELVLLWIADGLVQRSTNNESPKDLGREYFQDLLSRSIFQQSSGYNNSKFGMHDLFNDLAQLVSGERCFRLEHVLEGQKQSRWFRRARHASYICGACDGKSKFEVFHEAECLRTFLPILVSDHTPYITNAVISKLLPKFKKLRVLSLRKYCITELPNSIGGLRHLTYLNLSGTMIKTLPESVSLLFNLQILLLKDCSCLTKLPPDVGYLINLLHLDIKNVNLSIMPLGMGRLKYLERLSNFIVGKGLGSQVKDLMELKFLGGELCISGLENISNLENKILCDKKKLDVLQLEWESHFDDSRNEMKEKKYLTCYDPITKLKIS